MELQVSTRFISHRCGNLFIDRKFLLKSISESHSRFCEMEENKGLFEDEKLHQLMLSADEIWFASAWLYWQAELIKDSIENVTAYTSKKIKVFGRKDFGKIVIKDLLAMSPDKRILSIGIINESTIEVNALLESELSGFAAASFIDIQKLMCGNDMKFCSLFSDGGELISHDGGHLTKLGSKYFGEKLMQHNLLKSLTVAK